MHGAFMKEATPMKTDVLLFTLLATSYEQHVGKRLVPVPLAGQAAADWLYYSAPFCVLAHNAENDPVFMYANQAAQQRFGYSWEEITRLPSRLSAGPQDREERQRFIDQVKRDGYSSGYSGVRVMKSGRRFLIQNATLWQLHDAQGHYQGQAVLIPQSKDL